MSGGTTHWGELEGYTHFLSSPSFANCSTPYLIEEGKDCYLPLLLFLNIHLWREGF